MTPDWIGDVQVGDAATWATATFTAIFAGIAYYQLKAQRQELSEKLSNVGNKLDELKAERIDLDLEARRREEYRARRAQAAQVHLDRGDKVELLEPPVTMPTGYSYLAVTNRSGEPVRTVDVWFGETYAYDVGKLDPAAPGPQQLQDRHRMTLGEILPGDTWYFLVLTTYRMDVPDDQVYAFFTDLNGVRWRKNLIEELVEIPPPEPPRPGRGKSLAE